MAVKAQNLVALMVAQKALRRYQKKLTQWAEIEALRFYVRGLKNARLVVIGYLLLMLSVTLTLSGFLLVNIAIFFFAPWTVEQKMAVLVVGGVFYLLSGFIILMHIMSSKVWMKYFNVDRWIAKFRYMRGDVS